MSDSIKIMDLGDFSNEEKEILKQDRSYKKEISRIFKKARTNAKLDHCYFCGKNVTSFCNSHSIPEFCLRNIAECGQVLTLNTAIDNPLIDEISGIGKAGTFQLICNDCDSKIFSDYENPNNYEDKPTPKMIAQIALKNSLKSISKRLFEIELFNIIGEANYEASSISEIKNTINNMDLKEYEKEYVKAKKAIDKNDDRDYYVFFYQKLDYVVPIAFQSSLALNYDFEGNVINNIYNPSPKYEIKNLNLCVFPLKNESVIIMFIENNDKRYKNFYKQFLKLDLREQLAAITFIIFAYSEDVYFSKSIKDIVQNNKTICEAARTGQDIFSSYLDFNPMEEIKDRFDLSKRTTIPNILSEEYKLR